jgi:hypothetical protein
LITSTLRYSLTDATDHLAIWLISAVIMSPVLIYSHWGMFSDPCQFVEPCKQLFQHLDAHRMIDYICTNYRPGYQLINVAVWPFAADQPFAHYLLRWILFAVTVDCTYMSAKLLSSSRLMACLASLVWTFCLSTYEVIYTLDKGEIILACMFSVIVYAHLSAVRKIEDGKFQKKGRFTSSYALTILACSIFAAFTKQTGLLSVVLGALTFAEAILATFVLKKDSQSRPFGRLGWSFCVFLATSLACFLFAVFYVALGGLSYKYGSSDYSIGFLSTQAAVYVRKLPDLFSVFAISFLGLLGKYRGVEGSSNVPRFAVPESACLLLTALVGCLPLLAWKSTLTYIWLPLMPFVLPVFALALARIGSKSRWISVALMIGMALIFAPGAFTAAQFQFKMDSLFSELCDRLAVLPQKLGHETTVILPLHHQASFELGEEMEAATLDRLHKAALNQNRVKFANMTRYNWHDSTDRRHDPNDKPVKFVSGSAEEPGLDKCSYLSGPDPSWEERRIAVGDVVAIPYGDLDGRLRDYRGGDLFWRDWQTLASLTPQLNLMPVFQIDRKITSVARKAITIGWIVLEVTASPAISFSKLDPGGLLENNCKIEVGEQLNNKTLVLTIGKFQQSPLRAILDGASAYQIPLLDNGQHSSSDGEIDIPFHGNKVLILRSANDVSPLFELKSVRFR